MIRYRITLLFVLTVLVALIIAYIAAEGSHKRAFLEISKLDQKIHTTLIDIHPLISEVLLKEFDQEVVDNPTYVNYCSVYGNPNIHLSFPSPYSTAGNSIGVSEGCVFNGPSNIERDIVIDIVDPNTDFSILPISGNVEKVRIRIECYVPWRFFAGRPVVRIADLDRERNKEFLKLLTDELEKHHIEYTIDVY